MKKNTFNKVHELSILTVYFLELFPSCSRGFGHAPGSAQVAVLP